MISLIKNKGGKNMEAIIVNAILVSIVLVILSPGLAALAKAMKSM